MNVNEKNIKIKSLALQAFGEQEEAQYYELIANEDLRRENNFFPISFDNLVIIEDINEPHMTGSISFVDSNNMFDFLIFKDGILWLELDFFDEMDDEAQPLLTTSKKLRFNILDIKVLTDLADQKVSGPSGTPNKVLIRFASYGFFRDLENPYDDINPSGPDKHDTADFIAPISNYYNEAVVPTTESDPDTALIKSKCSIKTSSIKSYGTATKDINKKLYPEYKLEASWGKECKSFISQATIVMNKGLSEEYQKPLSSHRSFNDVWLKPEYFSYPRYKTSHIPRLTNLINYIKEYAILEPNQEEVNQDTEATKEILEPQVDFMFWEDMDQYNFKSLSRLVKENKAKEYEFGLDMDPNLMSTIVTMEVISDSEPFKIWNDIMFGEYIGVKPNWESPYRTLLGSNEQFLKQLIRYNYYDDVLQSRFNGDKEKGKPVIARSYFDATEGYSLKGEWVLEPYKFKTDLKYSQYRIVDQNYGFFNIGEYNATHVPWWDQLHYEVNGFTYNRQLDNPIKKEQTKELEGYTFANNNGRFENEYWQAQFDYSTLPGSIAYKIYKNIKWKLNENRKRYAEAKELKEKWKIYKEKICCERTVPQNFFALITKADKIYGGGATGLSTQPNKIDDSNFVKDSTGIYAYSWIEVEFWPRSDAEGILQNGLQIIKFDAEEGGHDSFPFVLVKPRGALEGHGIIEKNYNPFLNDEDPNTSKNSNFEQSGLERIKNVDKRYYTKDTRAYNLNEILNTAGFTLSQKDLGSANPDVVNAIETCQTLMSSPGISSKHKSDQQSGCKSTYPKGFNMMPIGSFRLIGDCGVQNEKISFGRIVQIHAIPKEMMQTIVKSSDGITLSDLPSDIIEGDVLDQPLTYSLAYKDFNGEIFDVPMESRKRIKERLSSKINEDPLHKKYFNPSPYMFIFDVENAHDGLCDNSGCDIV